MGTFRDGKRTNEARRMIQAKKDICPICKQDLNRTLDDELECIKCGYIKDIDENDN